MLTKKSILPSIACICFLEVLIYLWAVWTSTFEEGNFLAIESAFVFDKCARISGRISTVIILIPLLMAGHFGLKEIYNDERKKDTFRVLITLFTINHLIHFMFLFLRFKSHAAPLSIAENFHGFVTFIFIIIIPIILWAQKNLTSLLYVAIILHLFNVSYFINKTFWSKVKPDNPAFHNLLGIVVITAACVYILFRVFKENKRKKLTT